MKCRADKASCDQRKTFTLKISSVFRCKIEIPPPKDRQGHWLCRFWIGSVSGPARLANSVSIKPPRKMDGGQTAACYCSKLNQTASTERRAAQLAVAELCVGVCVCVCTLRCWTHHKASNQSAELQEQHVVLCDGGLRLVRSFTVLLCLQTQSHNSRDHTVTCCVLRTGAVLFRRPISVLDRWNDQKYDTTQPNVFLLESFKSVPTGSRVEH